MTRIFTILILLPLLFGSCKPVPLSERIGRGEVVIQGVCDHAFADYTLVFPKLSWSGHSSDDPFGRDRFSDDAVTVVKAAKVSDVANKLDREVQGLPTKQGWDSHGYSRSDDKCVSVDYEEAGFHYYIDFILWQEDTDVRIMILYKGVRR